MCIMIFTSKYSNDLTLYKASADPSFSIVLRILPVMSTMSTVGGNLQVKARLMGLRAATDQ